MLSTTQTKELLVAVAEVILGVDSAKGDDGRISIPEVVGMLTACLPAIITAIRGAGEIPAEARDFTAEELDDLYFTFLTAMRWDPTDNNRDLAAAYFQLIRDTYTNILRILNTHRPPAAEPV